MARLRCPACLTGAEGLCAFSCAVIPTGSGRLALRSRRANVAAMEWRTMNIHPHPATVTPAHRTASIQAPEARQTLAQCYKHWVHNKKRASPGGAADSSIPQRISLASNQEANGKPKPSPLGSRPVHHGSMSKNGPPCKNKHAREATPDVFRLRHPP